MHYLGLAYMMLYFSMALPRPTIGLGLILVIVSTVAVNDLIFLLIQVQQNVEFVQTASFCFRFVLSGETALPEKHGHEAPADLQIQENMVYN